MTIATALSSEAIKAATTQAAKEAAQAAAKEAAQQAAKEAAQQAAKEVAQQAAKEAAQQAAKEAAQQGAKEAAQQAAKEAAQQAAKEAAQQGAKEAAQQAAKEAAQQAAKEAAEVAARDAAKAAGTETAQTASQKAARWASEHPGLVVGGLAATGITAYTVSNFAKRNNKQFRITSITSAGNDAVLIKVDPADKITPNDRVTLTDTNCIPSLDGGYDVASRESSNTFIIKTGTRLAKDGTQGNLVLHTTFESQLASTMSDAAETTTYGITSGLSGAFKGLGLDFSKITEYKWYILAVCICLCCCCCMMVMGLVAVEGFM